MTHCDQHHDQGRGTQRLLVAFAVISVFMVVEAVGGILAGSLALVADAVHMLTDAFALGLAVSAQWWSRRPADDRLHFGYRRTQVLAAFVNGLFLSALLGWIVYEAVMRLLTPIEVEWQSMLIIALIGLGANAVAYLVLHGAPTRDINIRGAMLHVMSDMLGSVAAVIAALVIMTTGWTRIDPILSLLVAALIGRSALRLLRETSHILLEGAPRDIDVARLIEGVKQAAPNVVDVHDVYIWQLTPEHPRLTLHACIAEEGVAASTLDSIKTFLEEKYGISESTVQIEVGTECPDESSKVTPLRRVESTLRRHAAHHHVADVQPSAGAAFVGQK